MYGVNDHGETDVDDKRFRDNQAVIQRAAGELEDEVERLNLDLTVSAEGLDGETDVLAVGMVASMEARAWVDFLSSRAAEGGLAFKELRAWDVQQPPRPGGALALLPRLVEPGGSVSVLGWSRCDGGPPGWVMETADMRRWKGGTAVCSVNPGSGAWRYEVDGDGVVTFNGSVTGVARGLAVWAKGPVSVSTEFRPRAVVRGKPASGAGPALSSVEGVSRAWGHVPVLVSGTDKMGYGLLAVPVFPAGAATWPDGMDQLVGRVRCLSGTNTLVACMVDGVRAAGPCVLRYAAAELRSAEVAGVVVAAARGVVTLAADRVTRLVELSVSAACTVRVTVRVARVTG